VYQKSLPDRLQYWENTWSRDSKYELALTGPMPAFAPSGDRFVINPGGPFDAPLEIIETGSKSSRIAFRADGKGAMGAQWSPHGDSLFFGIGTFFLRPTSGAQVATIKSDGSGLHELTTGANNNGFPSPSPDGKHIVYRTMGPEGPADSQHRDWRNCKADHRIRYLPDMVTSRGHHRIYPPGRR
jgi:Tol biopolymer transport system component